MAGTNYPYVDYLPKKNIKAIQIDTNPDVVDIVSVSMLVSLVTRNLLSIN